MRYTPTVVYVQGIYQKTADALSRAPTSNPDKDDKCFIEEVEAMGQSVINYLPATDKRLNEIEIAQDNDAVCSKVKEFCVEGWPVMMPSLPLIRPFWERKQHLTINRGLLLYNDRLVIPTSMQLEILDALHEGHLGITKCQGRAKCSVWWPLITKQIESMVNKCSICAEFRPEHKEPLMATSYPGQPWVHVGTDLFEFKGKTYIVVVDYASRWFEIRKLDTLNSTSTIKAMSDIFSMHGIADLVTSGNRPQYASAEFRNFAKTWQFTHITSSPYHSQANGEAERAVQTAKNILKKNPDIYLGLLAYRTAPLRNGLSPCQILMNRQLRTTLPTIPGKQVIIDSESLSEKEHNYRQKYSCDYNRRHRVTPLPSLQTGDKVYIRDRTSDNYGVIQEKLAYPRSYDIITNAGSAIRRNRAALVNTGESEIAEKTAPLPSGTTPSLEQTPSDQSKDCKAQTASPQVRRSERCLKSNRKPEYQYY